MVVVAPEPPSSGPWDYERRRNDIYGRGVAQLDYHHSSPRISNTPVNLNPSGSQWTIGSVRTVPIEISGGSVGRRGHSYTGSSSNVSRDETRSNHTSTSTIRPLLPIQPQRHTPRRGPLVHAALLSDVADVFRQQIPLGDHQKYGTIYLAAFTGREAVDLLACIIKTSDRNLALLLGRALDAQKFFHDVTHNHRLRDSPAEIYQVSDPRPVTSWDTEAGDGESTPVQLGLTSADRRARSGTGIDDKDLPLPVGVFTLLTDCYSPTCSGGRICYSSSCPRHREQIARQQSRRRQIANSTGTPDPSLSGSTIAVNVGSEAVTPWKRLKENQSEESLIDHGLKEPGLLWVHSVPQKVVDSVSDQEKERQEAINEVVLTECEFVRDLAYLRDRWMKPLRAGDIIPQDRRLDFVRQVFWNLEEILNVSKRLGNLLLKRQRVNLIVDAIGDIFSEMVPHFGPFIEYGGHQLYGRHEFEKEKSTNPAFSAFVRTVERLPESRKLELNGYLMKPGTRLARYLPMLEAVFKHTPENNPDRETIPKVIEQIREFLVRVNEETGKTEHRFKLLRLGETLVFRPGEEVDLKLKDEQRQLVHYGSLEYRGGNANTNGNLQICLLDHVLLIARRKIVKKQERSEVFMRIASAKLDKLWNHFKPFPDSFQSPYSFADEYAWIHWPIPLELSAVSMLREDVGRAPKSRIWFSRRPHDDRIPNGTSSAAAPVSQKGGYPLTFRYLGRNGYALTLWAPTVVARDKWLANFNAIHERSKMFDTHSFNEGVFMDDTKVNCAVPYDSGQRIAYGTDNGIYFQSLHDGQLGNPVKQLRLAGVQQIDILEDYQLLVVLAERDVFTFPLDTTEEGQDPMKHMKRIARHTSFFKAGYCLGRTLICIARTSPLSSTIRILEPIDEAIRGKSKPTFKKLLQGDDTFKLFKEFYVPNTVHSISFLRTKLCVACPTGFEVCNIERPECQVLLDPADVSLDFAIRQESARPLNIYRIDGEFLLCYTEFAFFVNNHGRRSKKDVIIYWEGTPTGFALHYPYVMAFDPTFIEIRHLEDGALVQVIPGRNLRLLFADTQPSVINSTSSLARSDPSASNSRYQPPHIQRRAYTRDEIILVSDDKVMGVQLAPPRSSNASATAQA